MGTLFVNNVLASCYGNIHSHTLGQLAMAPLKWFHKFSSYFAFMEPSNFGSSVPNHGGLHWVPQAMLNFAERYFPSILSIG
jgi:hypothetical protein